MYLCISTTFIPGPHWGQKTVSDSWALKLEIVMSYLVQTKPRSYVKATCVINWCDISPTTSYQIKKKKNFIFRAPIRFWREKKSSLLSARRQTKVLFKKYVQMISYSIRITIFWSLTNLSLIIDCFERRERHDSRLL